MRYSEELGGHKLDIFVDSNVVIGYYFDYIDHWGPDAIKVFNSNKQIHSGKTVQAECFGLDGHTGRCNTIKNEILRNFSDAIRILIKTKSTDELVCTAFDEKWKTKEIIEDIYLLCKQDLKQFIEEIRNIRRKFETDCNRKCEKLLDGNTIIFHNRSEAYAHLYSLLMTEIGDVDDIEVILDAHHVVSMGTKILFISGDYKDIVPNIPFITHITAIEQIMPLGSFSDN